MVFQELICVELPHMLSTCTSNFYNFYHNITTFKRPEAEFKEFEPRLKYGWFHLKLYSIFQDLSRRSIETGF